MWHFSHYYVTCSIEDFQILEHKQWENESESEVTQSCPTLCDPVDCSLPGSSVHQILQARILEWVAISFSRGSSQPRDRTQVSRIGGRRFNLWATMEDTYYYCYHLHVHGTLQLTISFTSTEPSDWNISWETDGAKKIITWMLRKLWLHKITAH